MAINAARRLTRVDVVERLSDLFVRCGMPEHIWGNRRQSHSAGIGGDLSPCPLEGALHVTFSFWADFHVEGHGSR